MPCNWRVRGDCSEAFTLAAQVLGLQVGYAYASTIDPNSGSRFRHPAGVRTTHVRCCSLPWGWTARSCASSRKVWRKSGRHIRFGRGTAEPLIRLGSTLFSVGVRLALPVVALLVMVDVALALLGRINAQLQLLTLAFPAKMLIALILLSWISPMFPHILREISRHAWAAAYRMLGI